MRISDGQSTDARQAKYLVERFISIFSVITAVFGAFLAIIGYVNYTGNLKTIDDIKQHADSILTDFEKKSDSLSTQSITSAEIKGNPLGSLDLNFNIIINRLAIQDTANLHKYEIKFVTEFYIKGARGDGNNGIGQMVAMHLKFKGPWVDELTKTRFGADSISSSYLKEGVDWKATASGDHVLVSTSGYTVWDFSWSTYRNSCSDVERALNLITGSTNNEIEAFPIFDYNKIFTKRETLTVKKFAIVGEYTCDELK